MKVVFVLMMLDSEISLSKSEIIDLITSSKGNQEKYKKNGYWYKLDYLGYESLAEVLVCRFLKCLNLDYNVLDYDICKVSIDNNIYVASKSKDYNLSNCDEVSVLSLLRRLYGSKLNEIYKKYNSTEDRIKFVVDSISQLNGLDKFGSYLSTIIQIDAMTLNEDRHLHNILLSYNHVTDMYKEYIIFDNGAALLSDMTFDYKQGINYRAVINKVKAKPFSNSFSKQYKAVVNLYGNQLILPVSVSIFTGDFYSFYDKDIIKRACDILRYSVKRFYNCDIIYLK